MTALHDCVDKIPRGSGGADQIVEVSACARLHLSVDWPVATLWQTVTRGIARIFTGGERGTRTLDLGIMSYAFVQEPILIQ